MKHTLMHLAKRYPVPGIHSFISAAETIFPGQPDSYIEYFVNKTFERLTYLPPEINVSTVFGFSKHYRNLAKAALEKSEYKKFIDFSIIQTKLIAIAHELDIKEKALEASAAKPIGIYRGTLPPTL